MSFCRPWWRRLVGRDASVSDCGDGEEALPASGMNEGGPAHDSSTMTIAGFPRGFSASSAVNDAAAESRSE